VKKKIGQHAETDPKPARKMRMTTTTTTMTTMTTDDYSSHTGWLRDPSFINPAPQGGAPPRSDASSPESGAPIGPRPNPAHGPAVMAGSGLTFHPARHAKAAEPSRSEPRDMNRLASSVHHAARAIRAYSTPLLGSSFIEAEVWEDVCQPRETFVAVVVSED